MRWSLLKEYKSLRGVSAFRDTGTVFEADDAHAHLMALQEQDGCSYSAQPAPQGIVAALARAMARLSGSVRL